MNYPSMLRSFPRLACVLALATLGITGCGKAEEEATEAVIEMGMPDGAKVEIDSEGGNITIEGADGSVSMETGESVALPTNFPSDIPVPDGVTWQMVQGVQAEGNDAMTVQGTVATPLADVAAAMKEKAATQGWESVSSFQQGGEGEMMVYKKGERNLNISITKDGDKTVVLISNQ